MPLQDSGVLEDMVKGKRLKMSTSDKFSVAIHGEKKWIYLLKIVRIFQSPTILGKTPLIF